MRGRRGIRTRIMLLASLVLVIAGTTAASLLVVRNHMRRQVIVDLSEDLKRSVETFQYLEAQRLAALRRENALLADLPSLKALMTSNDQRTIADGAIAFWKTSGNDLFALADNDGRVLVVYTQGATATSTLPRDLESLITTHTKHYLQTKVGNEDEERLFEFSVRPLYFGSETNGTLLGYVISGDAIDHRFLHQVSLGAGAEAAFVSAGRVVESTLPVDRQRELGKQLKGFSQQDRQATPITIAGERYLASSEDMSAWSGQPLRLVVMKSFDQAVRAEHEINRLVSMVSIVALVVGSGLTLLLARMMTRPLELLTESVRAFGTGDRDHALPQHGAQEVRELSFVFARMREEIEQAQRALLESERLATIGRMASSVSHDIRHYLAAVYANAEFLSSSRLTNAERLELLADIQIAVHGTTDLIDSLLIFSRTGKAVEQTIAPMSVLVERAATLIRAHPDAEGVTLRMEAIDPASTLAPMETKQLERALYNLLLNACQSARESPGAREVVVALAADEERIRVMITDSGPGVAESIRESLFEPFVSQGKQKGTGLGLTLAHSVAQEHGGEVTLVNSQSGSTTFCLTISRKPRDHAMNQETNKRLAVR
jgi:signal transduction histidine kinase